MSYGVFRPPPSRAIPSHTPLLNALSAAAPADVTLLIGGLATEESTGGLTPSPGTVSQPIGGLATEETTGGLTPSAGTAAVSIGGLASEESTGGLTPSPGVSTVSLGGLASEESTGGLTPSAGTATAAMGGVASEESTGGLTPSAGNVTALIGGLATEESVGGLTPSVATFLDIGGIASDESAGGLTATPGTATAAIGGLTSEESTGGLAASGGAVSQAVGGLTSDESTGGLTPTQDTIPPTSEAIKGVPSEEHGAIRWDDPTLTFVDLGHLTYADASKPNPNGLTPAVSAVVTLSIGGLATEESVGGLSVADPGTGVPIRGLPTEEHGALKWDDATLTFSDIGHLTYADASVANPSGVLPHQGNDIDLGGLQSDETSGGLTPVGGALVALIGGLVTEEVAGSLAIAGDEEAALSAARLSLAAVRPAPELNSINAKPLSSGNSILVRAGPQTISLGLDKGRVQAIVRSPVEVIAEAA